MSDALFDSATARARLVFSSKQLRSAGRLAQLAQSVFLAKFGAMFSETIELRGHIIDSLTLPKVLDQIVTRGATFNIIEFKIGQKRVDPSLARIEISAPSRAELDELIQRLREQGAEVNRPDSRAG